LLFLFDVETEQYSLVASNSILSGKILPPFLKDAVSSSYRVLGYTASHTRTYPAANPRFHSRT